MPGQGAAMGLAANTTEARRIETTRQWEFREARLQVKAKQQAVQWIDGPDKTTSNYVRTEDLGTKPGKDDSVGETEAPQLEVQELELEQQPASQERKQGLQVAPPNLEEGTQDGPPDPEGGGVAPSDPEGEKREALSDPEGETREATSDPEEETQEVPPDTEEEKREALSDPEEETQKATLDPKEKTRGVVGPAAGLTCLGGPVVPARLELTISGNLLPNNAMAHVK